jgi:hypothetical protein
VKKEKNASEAKGAGLSRPAGVRYLARIAPEILPELDELIIEGWTLEGAAAAINESGKYTVALSSVEHYFRSNIDLQRRRIQFISRTASAITEHLPGNPDSPEKQIVNALVMGGLLKSNEKDAYTNLNIMMLRRAEIINLELRNKLMEGKTIENRLQKKHLEAQTQLMRARTEFVEGQTEKLREFVRKLEKKKNITPDTLEKIQAIYGLMSQSVAQAVPEIRTVPEQNHGDPNAPRDDGIETQAYYTNPVDRHEAAIASHMELIRRTNGEDEPPQPGQSEPAGQPRLLTEGEQEKLDD